MLGIGTFSGYSATSSSARSEADALAALAFGFGAGALLDVIVLHELLQWHHLFSARHTDRTLAGLKWNLRWDGALELAALALVVGSAFALRRREPADDRALAWLVLAGWGLFNVIDEFLFHLVLGAHHIKGGSRGSPGDWIFFAGGLVLFAGGVVAAGRASRAAPGA